MGHARNVVSGIKNAFTSINWGSIGSNIISGIANGIAGAVGGLVDAAVNAAKSAFNAAKNFLGINSPSRLFRDEIGKYMALGMGVGFERNIPVHDMEKSLDSSINKLRKSGIAVTTQSPSTTGYVSARTKVENGKQELAYLAKKIDKLAKRPIEVTTKVFDKAIAKSTAVPMQEEIQRNQKLQNMIAGVRT